MEVDSKQPEIIEIEIPDSPPDKPKRKYKPREKKTSQTVNATKVDAVSEISTLIQSISNIASFKFGQHWQIGEEESNSISTPLNSILNKFNLIDKVANLSDGVALVVATASVMIPRIIVQQQLNMQAKNSKLELMKRNGAISENGQTKENPRVNTETTQGINSGESIYGESIKAFHNSIQ